MGADGNPVIVYEDEGNTSTTIPQANSVNYYTNGANAIVSSNGGGSTSGQDVAIGPDGFARITFINNTGRAADFIQCTNASCSTNSTHAISFSGNGVRATSVAIAADGKIVGLVQQVCG